MLLLLFNEIWKQVLTFNLDFFCLKKLKAEQKSTAPERGEENAEKIRRKIFVEASSAGRKNGAKNNTADDPVVGIDNYQYWSTKIEPGNYYKFWKYCSQGIVVF